MPTELKVSLRDAAEKHSNELKKMIEAYHHFDHLPYDEALTERILRQLVGDPALGHVWIIELNHEPIGYVLLTFWFSLEFQGKVAFIDELYLRDDARGRGHGKTVLSLIRAAAEKLGVAALRLEVENTNGRARALYAKVGYRAEARTLMTLEIAPPIR